jgi:hypothetical protein
MSFSKRRLHVDWGRPHSRPACGIVRRRPGCSKYSEMMSRRLCASAGLLRFNRTAVRTRRAVSTTAGFGGRAARAPVRPDRYAISASTLVDIGGGGSACSGDFVWLTVMDCPHTGANRAPANDRDPAGVRCLPELRRVAKRCAESAVDPSVVCLLCDPGVCRVGRRVRALRPSENGRSVKRKTALIRPRG